MTNKYKEYYDAHGSLPPELYANLHEDVEKMQDFITEHSDIIANFTNRFENSPVDYDHLVNALRSYIKKNPDHAKKYGGVRAMQKADTTIAESILTKLQEHTKVCEDKCKELYSLYKEEDEEYWNA